MRLEGHLSVSRYKKSIKIKMSVIYKRMFFRTLTIGVIETSPQVNMYRDKLL